MKTSKLFSCLFVSVFSLGVLAGCGTATEKKHFGDATGDDAGATTADPPATRSGGHGSGSGSGGHGGPSGSPSTGPSGTGDTGGTTGTGDTADAGKVSTPDGGNISPGPGTGTGPGANKDGGSTPPPAADEDDPAGMDTEFVDDRGNG
jgi:hypothetical protein